MQPGTPSGSVPRRKLIEVSLPLEDINAESAREKSIRHGHPSTLHLWWARRPLAAARAVLFAQLVDDPSSHPELFPTEEEQKKERERLHGIIRRLVVWENINDEGLYREAREEILKSTGGNPPAILDPFAGGGTIPLEAQRLGLEAHASDLNPVPVLINKALIEIPPKFAGQPPVFPGAAESRLGPWPRATGLAEDVRRYGEWMRKQAQERIGHLYPKAQIPALGLDGEPTGKTTEATVIAWIWARTVTCPNPACGIRMPLVRSWWLSKKKGKEAYVVPTVVDDSSAPGGRRVNFTIGHDTKHAPAKTSDGTMDRGAGRCVACDTIAESRFVREEAKRVGLGEMLMAVVAEGKRQRLYLSPTPEQEQAARVSRPENVPAQPVPTRNHDVDRLPMYGMPTWADAFTNRQLTMLTSFNELVSEAREKILADAIIQGAPRGRRLAEGGTDAEAYADAVATYLGMAVSNTTDDHSSLVSWRSSHGTGATRSTFARQALPMVWDYAEANPSRAPQGISVIQFLVSRPHLRDWIPAYLGNLRRRMRPVANMQISLSRQTRHITTISDTPICQISSTSGCVVHSERCIQACLKRCWYRNRRNSSQTRTGTAVRRRRRNSLRRGSRTFLHMRVRPHRPSIRSLSSTLLSRPSYKRRVSHPQVGPPSWRAWSATAGPSPQRGPFARSAAVE